MLIQHIHTHTHTHKANKPLLLPNNIKRSQFMRFLKLKSFTFRRTGRGTHSIKTFHLKYFSSRQRSSIYICTYYIKPKENIHTHKIKQAFFYCQITSKQLTLTDFSDQNRSHEEEQEDQHIQ